MRKLHQLSHLVPWMLAAVSGVALVTLSPTPAQGLSGYGLKFDGVDDYVLVPGFGAIAPTTEITIEFWQKADGVAPQFTLGLSPDAASNRLAVATPWSDGKVYWDFGDISTDGRLSYTPPAPIVGGWQHFAFIASQAGNYMKIFRNGIEEATKAGMDPRALSATELRIGGLPGAYFSGLLDEVRIWNTARDQAAIQSTMNTSLNGDEPGLLGYWRFDEGMGTTAAESAGNSDGTLTNGPVWVRVPEPASLVLCCLAAGLLFVRQRHAK